MLYEFLTTYRDAIIEKTRDRAGTPRPPASTDELKDGVPIFLTQLAETLRLENTDTPFSQGAHLPPTCSLRDKGQTSAAAE